MTLHLSGDIAEYPVTRKGWDQCMEIMRKRNAFLCVWPSRVLVARSISTEIIIFYWELFEETGGLPLPDKEIL